MRDHRSNSNRSYDLYDTLDSFDSDSFDSYRSDNSYNYDSYDDPYATRTFRSPSADSRNRQSSSRSGSSRNTHHRDRNLDNTSRNRDIWDETGRSRDYRDGMSRDWDYRDSTSRNRGGMNSDYRDNTSRSRNYRDGMSSDYRDSTSRSRNYRGGKSSDYWDSTGRNRDYRDDMNQDYQDMGGRYGTSRSRDMRNDGTRSRSGARSPSGQARKPASHKRRHRRPILLLAVFLVFIIGFVLILKSCVGNHSQDSDYALEFSSQSIVVGETAQVKVTGLSEDEQSSVVWSSNDSSIVAVNNEGLIKAKKTGTATIGATFNDTSLSGTVLVVETAEGVEDLKLDKDSASVVSGENCQLNAEVRMKDGLSPAQVSWSSSDTSIAWVSSSGLVTARDVGTATITATCGTHSVMCTVTVTENTSASKHDESLITGQTPVEEGSEPSKTTPSNKSSEKSTSKDDKKTANSSKQSTQSNNTSSANKSVTGIDVSPKVGYLSVGDPPMTLEVDIAPNNAANAAVSWSSSDSSIATVSNGKVTAKKAGDVVITATAGGKSSSCNITVSAE